MAPRTIVTTSGISPAARRDILVAAWEEDAVLDIIRNLTSKFGEVDSFWLSAIKREGALGNLETYKYRNDDETKFISIDAMTLELAEIGKSYDDAVYLNRTKATLTAIRSLPPPPVGDSLWVIGLWGRPPC